MLSDQGWCHIVLSGMWAGAMAGRQVVSGNCRGLLLADVPWVPCVLAALRMAGAGERAEVALDRGQERAEPEEMGERDPEIGEGCLP